jgi:hypothetical protein
MSPDITVELTLRSEYERFPEASVRSAFEEDGLPRPTRLLTTDPKVRIFTLLLRNPSEDFIYGLQNILAGTGAKIVGTRVIAVPYDSESDIGADARLQIGRLENTDNCECSIEGCFGRATTRLTFTDHPERYRSGKYCPRHTCETLDRLRIDSERESTPA